MIMEHVGVRIDEIRRQWGLTIKDLSSRSGLSSRRLVQIIQFGTGITVGEAVALATALRSVTARDLLIYQVNFHLKSFQP